MTNNDDSEDDTYRNALRKAQVEFVKFHKHVIDNEQKMLVILEGRNAAGKDGAAKRITEHLIPIPHQNDLRM